VSERVGVWAVPRDASKNSATMVSFIRIQIVPSFLRVHVSILRIIGEMNCSNGYDS